MAYQEEDFGSDGSYKPASDSDSEEEKYALGELPEGLWLIDTGTGHDLTDRAGPEKNHIQHSQWPYLN